MTPVARAVRALRLLERGPQTKAHLAAELGVSERAVKRYLRALQDAGVRIESDDDHKRRSSGKVGRGCVGARHLPRLYWITAPPECDAEPAWRSPA